MAEDDRYVRSFAAIGRAMDYVQYIPLLMAILLIALIELLELGYPSELSIIIAILGFAASIGMLLKSSKDPLTGGNQSSEMIESIRTIAENSRQMEPTPYATTSRDRLVAKTRELRKQYEDSDHYRGINVASVKDVENNEEKLGIAVEVLDTDYTVALKDVDKISTSMCQEGYNTRGLMKMRPCSWMLHRYPGMALSRSKILF